MKKSLKSIIILFLCTVLCSTGAYSQSVGINTTGAAADSSAMLDIDCSPLFNKGLLIPRMTEAQKNAIPGPAASLMVFQTDGATPGYYYNAGTPGSPNWVPLGLDNLGNHSATQDLDMNSYRITELADPTQAADAVNAASVQDGSLVYAADAGSTDDYAITLAPAVTAYTAGMAVHFKANTANTGAATLNVNGLGAITIKKDYNSDLDDNDILAGQLVTVIHDGTNFQMLSAASGSGGGGSGLQTVNMYTLGASCKWSPMCETTWTFAELYPAAFAAGEVINQCFFRVGFNNGNLLINSSGCTSMNPIGGSCWSCSNIGPSTTWSSVGFTTDGCISGVNTWAIPSNGNVLICIK